MKRFLLALLLIAVPASAANQSYTEVSATQTNTAVSFGFVARYVLVVNDGTDEVYIDFSDTTATTSDYQLKANEFVSIPPASGSITGIGIICDTGETATVRVLAIG